MGMFTRDPLDDMESAPDERVTAPIKFLGFDLERFPDRWISGQDAVREIGAIITVFEDDDSIIGARWKVGLEYGDNLRLLASAPTLADAEEDIRVKLRAVVRWSLRAIEGKVPVHSCLACGYEVGRAVNRNEPPLHRLAACPNVDPRIREDAAQRLARRRSP